MMVISWLTRFVSSQIVTSITCFDTAFEIWLDLQVRFSDRDYFRLCDLLQEIHSYREGDQDLATYFTNLTILWKELDTLCPNFDWACNIGYSCPLVRNLKKYSDNDVIRKG